MYKKMAEIYDLLMSDAPYDEWVKFTEHMTSNYSIESVLDIGCGTGEVSLRLAKNGYDVTAFDLSEEMIEVAKQKALNRQIDCQFSQNNATDFNFKQRFDLIVSYCDVMNYIVNKEELLKAFKRIYNHLDEDGLLIFDVHSLAYVDWLIEREIFSEIRDDISHVWLCEQGTEIGEIHHDLTFFIQKEDNLYERYDEQHVQRTYSINDYKQFLYDIGFKTVKIYYDFSTNELDKDEDDADRVFFVCSKK